MNNMNREEPTRYVPISSCDFIVDRDVAEPNDLEPSFISSDVWERVKCKRLVVTSAQHASSINLCFQKGKKESMR